MRTCREHAVPVEMVAVRLVPGRRREDGAPPRAWALSMAHVAARGQHAAIAPEACWASSGGGPFPSGAPAVPNRSRAAIIFS
jgi:hypothetical protein